MASLGLEPGDVRLADGLSRALEEPAKGCVGHVGSVELRVDHLAPLEQDDGVDVLLGEVSGSALHDLVTAFD